MTDRKTDGGTFCNCFSLGWSCGTASALSRLGLRSCSGPFDWCISSYPGVLRQIETNFQDFLNRDHLELDQGDEFKQTFYDRKYDILFPHDILKDFEREYEMIYQKYQRRYERFSQMIRKPTVFFRTVKDEDEVNYINKNWEWAEGLLKKYNSQNHIVYVCRRNLHSFTNDVHLYVLGNDEYTGEVYELRHLFDSSEELLEFCSTILTNDQTQRNVLFDQRNIQQNNAGIVDKCVREKIDGIDREILRHFDEKKVDVSQYTGLYLWGAGKYGIRLAKYLNERGIKIAGIIDNNRYGRFIEGFGICSFDEVPDGAPIFIAVSRADVNLTICNQIKKSYKSCTVIKYEDLDMKDFDRFI